MATYDNMLNLDDASSTKAKETVVAYPASNPAVIPYWNMIKSASNDVKQDLIEMLQESLQEDSVRKKFYQHYKAWMEETMFVSNSRIIRQNEHFRAMTNMGQKIVPYIVDILKTTESSHLTWILTEIFGAPITKDRVTNSQACKLWIERLDI